MGGRRTHGAFSCCGAAAELYAGGGRVGHTRGCEWRGSFLLRILKDGKGVPPSILRGNDRVSRVWGKHALAGGTGCKEKGDRGRPWR